MTLIKNSYLCGENHPQASAGQIYLPQGFAKWLKQSNPKEVLMEKRIGAALIMVHNRESVNKLNQIISQHASIIIGRQGIPITSRGVSVISLVLEGDSDQIGAFTGPIGKLNGIQVKTIMMKPEDKQTIG